MTPHAAMLQDLPVFRPAMARLLDQKRRSEATGLTASGAPSLAAVDARYPAEVVRRLVVKIFTRMAGVNQVPMALCVADRESHFDPLAKNPFSGASGVFQWIPSSWASYSARYGFGESSVFDPMANIIVAARAVAASGWGPWAVPGC